MIDTEELIKNEDIVEEKTVEDGSAAGIFDSDELKHMDEEGIDKDISKMDLSTLNFAELLAYYNSLKKNLSDAKSTLTAIQSFRETSSSLEELQKSLSTEEDADQINLKDFEDKIDQFEKEYSELEKTTTETMNRIKKEMDDRYGDNPKTSTFIVGQMIELIDKKEIAKKTALDDLIREYFDLKNSKSDPEKMEKNQSMQAKLSDQIKRFDTMKEALQDRENMIYWTKRFTNEQIIRATWKEVRNNYDKVMKDSVKYLLRIVDPNSLDAIRDVFLFSNVYPGCQLAIACIFHQLAKCYRFGHESGKDFYARGFLMNVNDYIHGTYDYHEENPVWLPKFIGACMEIFKAIMISDQKGYYVKQYMKTHIDELKLDASKIDRFNEAVRKEKEKEISASQEEN